MYTGLRAGELWGLRVDRLNLLKRSLRVEQSLSEVRGEVRLGRLKTQASKRSVSLPRFLSEILSEHIEQFSDEFVFTAPGGGAVRHRNFMRRHFDRALVDAGLPRDVTFHDLRHTCASPLITQGWTPSSCRPGSGIPPSGRPWIGTRTSSRTTMQRY